MSSENLLKRAKAQLEVTPLCYILDKSLVGEMEKVLNQPFYPKAGDKFTVSKSKQTGDLSYTHEILTCLNVNELSVEADREKPLMPGMSTKIILLKVNHDFALMPQEEPKAEFYVGQQVLVSDDHHDKWCRRIYIEQKDGRFLAKCYETNDEGCLWDNCKPDPEATTLPEWIEVNEDQWDESIRYTDKEMCIAIYKDGEQFLVDPKSHGLYLKSVVRYAIIPLARFINND